MTRDTTPCKIGTVPRLVIRDRRQPLKAGRKIRVRDAADGSKWFRVLVTRVNGDGYFFADKI